MPKQTVVTPAVLARVKVLIEEGLSAAEIANQVGCTVGTLRVRCSQNGISLRRRKSFIDTNSAATSCPVGRRLAKAERNRNNSARPQHLQNAAYASGVGVELRILLSELTAQRLQQRAALNGITGPMLAARLLTMIDRDGLYDAVLDG
jgi:hypothetical protein